MLESAIGASHCLALATRDGIGYPSDIFPSRRFYERDLTEPGLDLSGPSEIRAFPGSGIGCAPDPARLRERTVEWCSLRR